MTIKEIYIEGFGKLKEYKKSFSSGLNSIIEENGFGKTTMTAFIKAMLYGLTDTRVTKLDENPRKHYTPWSGGTFGGYLTFEENGRCYRIERTFGKKASEDTFALVDLDTGAISKDYSENIGEEMFGIDEDGFERTVFLSERNLTGKNTNPTIAAKLSNITYADGDIGGFDIAIKLLEDKRRAYQRRGGAGEIQDLQNEIFELERRIADLKEKRCSTEDYTQRISEAKRRMAQLALKRDRIADAQKSEQASVQRRRAEEVYARMRADMIADIERKKELESFFGNNIPTEDDIFAIRGADARLETLHASRRRIDAARVRDDVIFTKRVPDESELLELRRMIGAANAHENTANKMHPMPESPFTSMPSRERIAALKASIGRRSSVRSAATLLFIGFALAAVGVLRILWSSIIPIVVGICGILLTFVGIYMLVKAKNKSSALAEAKIYIVHCYGYLPDGDGLPLTVSELLDKALRDLVSYESDVGIIERHNEKCAEAAEEYEIVLKELAELISKFTDLAADPVQQAMELWGAAVSKKGADKSREHNDRLAEEIADDIAMLESKKAEFFARYTTKTDDPLREIEKALSDYRAICGSLKRMELQAQRFAADNGIDINAPVAAHEAPTATVDLTLEMKAADEEYLNEAESLAALNSEYDRLMTEIERIDELEEKCRELQDKEGRLRENLDIICKTKDMLTKAKDQLCQRYLAKVRAGFDKYVAEIDEAADFTIDNTFTLTRTDHGKSRGTDSYSRGTRDLYALAMRLALIDALFEGSIPPVMLDDPFSALDDRHLSHAIAAVKRLAQSRQIFYFTCTKARKV